jgi:hypothetical protein
MSLGACNVKEARRHLRGWAPECSRVWSASPSRRDWAEPVLVLYGPGTLCTIELRSTSHTQKTSRPATDLGCCHGLEKQHRLQDFHIRGMATRPLLLSSLYQVHINVLDKIFQITGRIHNECRHQKGIQRLATLQYSSHFIYLYTARLLQGPGHCLPCMQYGRQALPRSLPLPLCLMQKAKGGATHGCAVLWWGSPGSKHL